MATDNPEHERRKGQLFQQEQIYSLLMQNPATAKYMGQADVCRIVGELRSNPAAYAKYRNDSRIVELATHLASYSTTNNADQGGTTSNASTTWLRARRDRGATSSPASASASASASTTFSASTFFAAVRSGALASVSAVVDSNPTALFQEDDFGYTPLHLAAQNGHTHIVNYLLGKGADVDQKQAAGYSPLHIAVLSDKTSVALTLIENGANMQLQDNEGNTALEYALRNDNPELISVLIEAATGDASQQSQRERRRQENERKRQTAALALPVQVERKIVRGQRTNSHVPPPRRPAGPSLFDDDDLSLFDAEETTAWPSHTTSSSSEKEEKAEGDLTDLFGFGDDDDEDDYVPKGKEVKPSSSSASLSHSRSHSGRKVSWADLGAEDDDEQEQNHWQGMIASLFPDDNEGDDEEDIFPTTTTTSASAKPSSTTTPTLTHPLAQPTAVARSTAASTSASVAIKTDATQTMVVVRTTSVKASAAAASSAPGNEVDKLLAQIQQLEARLAEKDRELLAKDDKISILEEDTWCRICMDKKIETVLLWCGHNILCTPCSQKVQKSKKDCPVCAKPIARVVRTYRA